MRAALFALALFLAPLTPQAVSPAFAEAVARRCAGESAAVALCACTVRTRLAAGDKPANVLNAYFARNRKPTVEQVQQATDGLNGVGCPTGDAYFLFSKADINKLGLRVDCSVANAGGVWAFAKDALRVCR